MRKLLLLVVLFLTFSIGLNPLSTDAAIADGTYTINFQVNKPDSSSASMANDYFMKPAKLIVTNGAMKVQITIKNSSWVTELNPPGGLSVISTNAGADQRVVQFSLKNFSPLKVNMTIDIDDIDYHHSYGTDFRFFEDSIVLVQAASKPAESTKPSTQQPSTQQPNNQQNTKPNTNSSGNANSGSQSSSSSSSSSSSNSSSNAGASSQTNANEGNQGDGSSSEGGEQVDEGQDVTEEEQSEETASNEEVENPETSDALPFIYVLLLMGAILLVIKTKNIQKQ